MNLVTENIQTFELYFKDCQYFMTCEHIYTAASRTMQDADSHCSPLPLFQSGRFTSPRSTLHKTFVFFYNIVILCVFYNLFNFPTFSVFLTMLQKTQRNGQRFTYRMYFLQFSQNWEDGESEKVAKLQRSTKHIVFFVKLI